MLVFAEERRDHVVPQHPQDLSVFRPMSHPIFMEVIICLVTLPTPARPGQTIS